MPTRSRSRIQTNTKLKIHVSDFDRLVIHIERNVLSEPCEALYKYFD